MSFLNKHIKIYGKKFLIALMFLTVEAVCDLLQPTIMSKIIDYGVARKNMDYVLFMGMMMLLVTAAGATGAVIRSIVSSRVSQSFGARLRGDLFKNIQSLSFDNLDDIESATLITRLTSDINQVQNFAHGMMRIFVKAPILCVGSLIMAAMINPSMALILLALVPVIGSIIYINLKVGYPFFMNIQKSLDKVNEVVREYLAGVRVVKAFNSFEYEIKRFKKANSELAKASIKGMRVMAVFFPIISISVNIGIILVLWLGAGQVNSGNMHVGQIIAFINYMTQILFSLIMLSHVFNMFIRAKASAERIGEVFSQGPGLICPIDAINPDNIRGKVEFDDVTFSYKGTEGEPVLKNISFVCNPGETVGIIGSTASGKTSMINLIPRFYDPNSGSVKVEDIDIRHMNQEVLRKIIALVPQKVTLFSGTILENIRWGNETVSISEIEDAVRAAQAHDFIMSFPKGYDTILGQGGVNLSGGQKQRISIARALVRKPAILLLDDCTSALDMVTEVNLRAGIKNYLGNITCFLVTQRITAVMNADKIIVLDNGKISSMGNHEELMKNCGIYKDIYHSQIGRME